MKSENAVILKRHGVVAAGPTMDEAILLAEFIEDIAKTQFIAHVLNLNSE
jgi:L-fuculose-phosphate aldolase